MWGLETWVLINPPGNSGACRCLSSAWPNFVHMLFPGDRSEGPWQPYTHSPPLYSPNTEKPFLQLSICLSIPGKSLIGPLGGRGFSPELIIVSKAIVCFDWLGFVL